MPEEEDLELTVTRRVGSVLHGKYHLDRVLGVGGMAAVYAATHRNRKRFAIKLLHPEYSVRRNMRARFVREGYVANSVNHPGAVVVLDDDVDEAGTAFLVMELLEGVSVESLYVARKAAVPAREALGIALQLLEVLEVAHAESIVHRDIKPANLFLKTDGELKVLDFGIARLREGDGGLQSTRTGALLGTPAFMAPEQALATPSVIDERTDLWAVGATLFTLLSARFVHDGDNARQIMIRAATEPARSLSSVAPELPAPVVALVARALAFDKTARWESAAAMKQAVLEAHRELFGEPERAPLSALVKRATADIGAMPTEASPNFPSDSAADPMLLTPGSSKPIESTVLTTTARPVSTGGRQKGTHFSLLARWGIAATGVAVTAGAAFVASSRSGEPTAPSEALDLRNAPLSTPENDKSEPQASGPPPAGSSSARGQAVEPSVAERRSTAPRGAPTAPKAAPPPPARAARPKPLPAAERGDPKGEPAPSVTSRNSNPLQLELQ